jgi:hypothetical protein
MSRKYLLSPFSFNKNYFYREQYIPFENGHGYFFLDNQSIVTGRAFNISARRYANKGRLWRKVWLIVVLPD